MSRRGVVRASIFGSVARGEAAPGSDVDFLGEFEKDRTLVDLAGLRLDLCETAFFRNYAATKVRDKKAIGGQRDDVASGAVSHEPRRGKHDKRQVPGTETT